MLPNTMKIIPIEIPLNEKMAMLIISDQFNIDIHSIKIMKEGFDNTVYLINNHLLFRFPKRRIAIPLIKREITLLPILNSKLNLKIPRPLFIGKSCHHFNAPFFGYEFLKGHNGSEISLTIDQYERLALDLGHFLKNLHSIKLKPYLLNHMKPIFDRADFSQTKNNLRERIRYCEQYYHLGIYKEKIKEIIYLAQYYQAEKHALSLVHGDLYHRHLLFDNNHILTGIIDWGDISMANRVADLGIVYQFLLPQVRHLFFTAYGDVEDEEKHYARYIGLYYAIVLLWFGHDRKDKELITTAITTLDQI